MQKLIKENLKQKFAGKIKELKKKENALVNLLMGEVMKLSNGKADPKIAIAYNTLHQQALKEKLKEQRTNCHADLRRHFMKYGIKFTRVTLKGLNFPVSAFTKAQQTTLLNSNVKTGNSRIIL